VVLTDVQMPGSMDGVKLAHYVRERFPPTVLFVVSGNAPIPAHELPARATFLPALRSASAATSDRKHGTGMIPDSGIMDVVRAFPSGW
jgi:CheY-like chemotaxis protein